MSPQHESKRVIVMHDDLKMLAHIAERLIFIGTPGVTIADSVHGAITLLQAAHGTPDRWTVLLPAEFRGYSSVNSLAVRLLTADPRTWVIVYSAHPSRVRHDHIVGVIPWDEFDFYNRLCDLINLVDTFTSIEELRRWFPWLECSNEGGV